jgi:hypothetical protein
MALESGLILYSQKLHRKPFGRAKLSHARRSAKQISVPEPASGDASAKKF